MSGGARQRYLDLVAGQRRGLWPTVERLGLWLASWPYRAAVGLRNLAYQQRWLTVHSAPAPVISVGNLTVGGTGKTPCVEYIARFYRQLEYRVAILSRGYGGGSGPNDEALVLEENLPDVPHLQGADRVQLAQTAVHELHSEVLVLDDGFQHRRLARDLDVVLVDASAPWGHGYLLPRGLLREPLASLRRAHVVLLTRCDQVSASQRGQLRQRIEQQAPTVVILEARHRPIELINSDGDVMPLEVLREQRVGAFCGLGNPEAFRRSLLEQGARVDLWRTYPDHHAYSRADVDELRDWARQLPPEELLVTTQKDLVKLRLARLGDRPLWALRIALHIEEGQDIFHRHLQAALCRPPAPDQNPPSGWQLDS
jgi:tetraacyldisaccharide 4'-kinase